MNSTASSIFAGLFTNRLPLFKHMDYFLPKKYSEIEPLFKVGLKNSSLPEIHIFPIDPSMDYYSVVDRNDRVFIGGD